jgi:hypothetical protein
MNAPATNHLNISRHAKAAALWIGVDMIDALLKLRT